MKYQIRYIIFVAFFLSSSLVAKAETNLEKISLQLQWKEQFQFAGYFIAKEKGFYEDVGLDVEIKKFTNTTLVIKEVIENRATYGTGRSSLLVDKGNKADIKLLASIFQTTPLILLTTNKDIQTISDIKGKKIMFTEDSITTSSLLATMSSNQITNSDLIKIKHSFDINDLITHKTDLMVAYSSSEPYLLKKKGIPFKMFSPKDYGFDFYSDILFTSTSEIKQNPRRVANFKNASLKGWEYAFNHIEETVDILLKKYNEQNKTRDELLFEARELKTLAYYDNAPLGDIDKNKLERIYDLYKLMGKINNIYDISELLEEESEQIVFTKEELAYLKKHPVLKAHNKSLCQPMNYNDGIAKGFSVDYMNLIAKKIGVKVEYIGGYSWSEFLSLLQTQALDVIINIVKTEDELKTISFQEPYYTLYNAIYVNSDSSIYYSLESLENKKVGTIKESYIQKYLSKNYPKIKQVTVENQLEALHLLSLGKIDAVIGEKVIIDNLIANNNIPKVIAITYLDEKDMVADLRLGVAKSDTVLHTILQKGKAKISEEEMRELKKRWFLSDTINNDNNLILTNDEKKYLKNKKILTVCVKQDCLPFESFSQNGEYIGINADYLRYYAKKLKLQLKIIPITNLSSDFDLLQKNCDIQSIFNKNIKVELPYVATNVYFGDKISLTTKVDTPYIPTLESVKMKKFVMVGMNKEFCSYMKYKYPDLNITIVPTIYEALKRVDNGTVYGYIGTSFISSYYIQKYFSKDLKISNSFDNLNFSFGISNKELELLPILNKVIASMPKEEDMEIFHKWIVQPLTVDNSQDSINKIILIFTSIFLVLIYFYLKELRLKKKIEEKGAELKVYKDRLEFAFEGSNDGLWDWDLTTNHLFLSIRWKSMLGYEESELSNQYESWESIIHPDDLADFRESIQNHFDKKTILYENIHRIKHKNGDWVWIKTRGKARFNDSGEVIRFLGTNTDITREKDLTDNLAELVSKSLKELRAKDNIVMQQSKLAAMGEMVGNIAHQWRQPLNAIGAMNMRVETMLEYGEVITSDSYAKISLDINHQLKFMSKTIDDFREFYTNKKVKAQFDIFGSLTDVISLVQSSYSSKNITIHLEGKSIFFYGLKNELKQVFINILNNAKDAIITLQNQNQIKEGFIFIKIKKENNHVVITIKDNGGGIEKSNMEKIFDPYFTTKFKSQGTGIGLYMSYQIISEHMHGELTVKNENFKCNHQSYKGAVFSIILPSNNTREEDES